MMFANKNVLMSVALGATLLPALLACGSANAALADFTDKVGEKVEDVGRGVDEWVNAEPMQQRRKQCQQEGGSWAKEVKFSACSDGHMTLEVDGASEVQACHSGTGGSEQDQCVHKNADGLSYFNDGPSVPHLLQRLSSSISGDIDQLKYLELFWPAGVNHDYCYHHGASVYGLDQAECDSQYFSDLSAVCQNQAFHDKYDWFKRRSCRQVAATHYAAVRAQGGSAYGALNSYVVYPAWSPLWQQFGMPHDVIDQDLAEQIEAKLDLVGLLPQGDEG